MVDSSEVEEAWDELPHVPACSFADIVADRDPGRTPASNPNPQLLTFEEKKRKDNCAAIAALENSAAAKLSDDDYMFGCIRAGMERVKRDHSRNHIDRFVSYVSGYAAGFMTGVTRTRYKMWLSDERYWKETSNRAEAAAAEADTKRPLLYMLISKCAADRYVANFLVDEAGNLRQHRETLNEIYSKLAELNPNRLIILIDVPARLIGCSRTKPTSTGYCGCNAITVAGLQLLKHMLEVIMTTAVSCGIAVGGIAAICADVTVDWLNELVNGSGASPPPHLLYDTVANYEPVRMEWSEAVYKQVVVGRGLHYVFMHISDYPLASDMCKRLTCHALSANKTAFGDEDVKVLLKLCLLFHDLAGAKGRVDFVRKLKDAMLDDVEGPVLELLDLDAMLNVVARLDFPDFVNLDVNNDADDNIEDNSEEDSEDNSEEVSEEVSEDDDSD